MEEGYNSSKNTCPAKSRHVLTLNERTLPGKIMASAPTCTLSHSSECEICAWSPTRTLSSRWQPVMWAPRPMWQLRPITEASTCTVESCHPSAGFETPHGYPVAWQLGSDLC